MKRNVLKRAEIEELKKLISSNDTVNSRLEFLKACCNHCEIGADEEEEGTKYHDNDICPICGQKIIKFDQNNLFNLDFIGLLEYLKYIAFDDPNCSWTYTRSVAQSVAMIKCMPAEMKKRYPLNCESIPDNPFEKKIFFGSLNPNSEKPKEDADTLITEAYSKKLNILSEKYNVVPRHISGTIGYCVREHFKDPTLYSKEIKKSTKYMNYAMFVADLFLKNEEFFRQKYKENIDEVTNKSVATCYKNKWK